MPLIGTGKRRFPEDFVLRVMREEFEKFSSMYLPGTLKQIKLVRYDQGGRRTTVQAQPLSGELLKKYQILLSASCMHAYTLFRQQFLESLIFIASKCYPRTLLYQLCLANVLN